MRKDSIKNVVWKEGKYYVAQCLNFDVSSFGRTKKSALKNLREALLLYLDGFASKKIPSVKFPELVETTL